MGTSSMELQAALRHVSDHCGSSRVASCLYWYVQSWLKRGLARSSEVTTRHVS